MLFGLPRRRSRPPPTASHGRRPVFHLPRGFQVRSRVTTSHGVIALSQVPASTPRTLFSPLPQAFLFSRTGGRRPIHHCSLPRPVPTQDLPSQNSFHHSGISPRPSRGLFPRHVAPRPVRHPNGGISHRAQRHLDPVPVRKIVRRPRAHSGSRLETNLSNSSFQ